MTIPSRANCRPASQTCCPPGSESAAAAALVEEGCGVRGLASLHEQSVAVQILAQGRDHMVRGSGLYEIDPDLGGVLRVRSGPPDEGVELLFVESQWTGHIRSGRSLGCDFLIRVH